MGTSLESDAFRPARQGFTRLNPVLGPEVNFGADFPLFLLVGVTSYMLCCLEL